MLVAFVNKNNLREINKIFSLNDDLTTLRFYDVVYEMNTFVENHFLCRRKIK